jgi:hypothetical protein
MGVIVGSASLLHSLAVRRLGERGAAAKDDEKAKAIGSPKPVFFISGSPRIPVRRPQSLNRNHVERSPLAIPAAKRNVGLLVRNRVC